MKRWISIGGLVLGAISGGWAAEVRWTAAGTVNSVNGSGMSAVADPSDPVTITLTYNNEAVREALAVSEFPGGWSHLEYRVDIQVDLTIMIGENTWRGTLTTGGEGLPRAIEVVDFEVGPETKDEFRVALSAADGANFPAFVGVAAGAESRLLLNFSDSTSVPGDPKEAPNYLGEASLVCVSDGVTRITEARGTIDGGGGETIGFTIDPGTIRTELVGVQALEITHLSYDPELIEVTIGWTAEIGKRYRIQYLNEFLCWTTLLSVTADQVNEMETFFPSGFEDREIYRVAEFD